MKLLCVLLLFCAAGFAQEPDYTYIPDAPSTTYAYAQQQDDSTESRDFRQYLAKKEKPKPAGFWTFRKGPDAPILRSNKEMFKSKTYVLSMAGGAIAMVVACRNKRSGEDFASEVPAVIGVDAMSYLMGRFFAMPLAVGPQVYEMVHYSIAATK